VNYAFLVGLGVPNAALDSRDVKVKSLTNHFTVGSTPADAVWGHGTDGGRRQSRRFAMALRRPAVDARASGRRRERA